MWANIVVKSNEFTPDSWVELWSQQRNGSVWISGLKLSYDIRISFDCMFPILQVPSIIIKEDPDNFIRHTSNYKSNIFHGIKRV